MVMMDVMVPLMWVDDMIWLMWVDGDDGCVMVPLMWVDDDGECDGTTYVGG